MGRPWNQGQPHEHWTPAGPPSPPGPTRPATPLSLPGAVVKQALVAGAAAVGAALAVACATALVLTEAASTTSTSQLIGSPLPGAGRLGAWLFGLGVGAPLVVEGGGSTAPLGAASAHVTVHLSIPLVLAAAIGTATALTWRSQRRAPVTGRPAMLAAAGCAAVVPFAVGLLVAALSRFSYSSGSLDGSGSASVGVAVARGGLLPALTVFVVALVTRVASAEAPLPEVARRPEVGAAVRAVVDYVVVTAVLMTVVVLVVLVASGTSAGGAFGVSLLWLPVLGVVATEMAAFAPLTVSGSIGGILPTGSGSLGGQSSLSLYGGAAPGWWALGVLVPILGVVVAGARYARRRPATVRPPWAAAGISAGTLVAVLFLINLYAGISISAGGQASSAVGSGSGGLSAGVGVGGIGYLSALVVGALLPLTGWAISLARRSAAEAPAPSAAVTLPPPMPQPASWSAPVPAWPETGAPVDRPTVGHRQGARPRTVVLLAASGTVLTAAAAVLVVVIVRDGHTTVGQASAAIPSATTETVPNESSGGGGTKSQPTFPSATAPEPTYPTTSPGGMDLTAVAANPLTSQIASVLDTYFGSINAHDGAGAASVFDPSGTIDPTDPAQVADFNEQISTTHDDQVAIHSISVNGAEYLVEVSFRSQQAADYGPDGQTCTNWHLTYRFTSAMKLIKAINAAYASC